MDEQKKEVVISTENINCYGARVLTDGIDTSQFERNPVLLYMHQRWGRENMPIGRIENLRKEDGKLIGTPVFDMNDPDAKKIADKWDNDFLRMVSPALEIIATSDEPELLLAHQIRPTVIKSKLIEVSIVDIGGNDDALPLQFEHSGQVLELASGQPCAALPLLELKKDAPAGDNNNEHTIKDDRMEKILLALGLNKDATSEQAVEAIASLKTKADGAEQVRLAAITSAVQAARDAGKFTADKEAHFIELGKTAGLEALNATLELMRPAQKPTDVIDKGAGKPAGEKVELAWGDLTPDAAEKLKTEKPDEYVKLYKAEFGFEPA